MGASADWNRIAARWQSEFFSHGFVLLDVIVRNGENQTRPFSKLSSGYDVVHSQEQSIVFLFQIGCDVIEKIMIYC